jgi:hypothetical protein
MVFPVTQPDELHGPFAYMVRRNADRRRVLEAAGHRRPIEVGSDLVFVREHSEVGAVPQR